MSHRTTPGLTALAAAIAISLLAAGVQAEGADADVLAWLEQAAGAYRGGRFSEAEAAYEKAFAAKPDLETAAALADSEREQSKHAEAAGHYAYALRHAPEGVDRRIERSLRDALAEMESKVATIFVDIDRPGATIVVNGVDAGQSPLDEPIYVEPGACPSGAGGAHTCKVEASLGGMKARGSAAVAAGKSSDVYLVLTRAPDAAPAHPAREQPWIPLLMVGGGLAAAGIGVGVAFTLIANDKANEAEEGLAPFRAGERCITLPEECRAVDEALGARDDFALGALIGFIAGGVFAAATTTYAIIPTISSSEAAVAIVGSF